MWKILPLLHARWHCPRRRSLHRWECAIVYAPVRRRTPVQKVRATVKTIIAPIIHAQSSTRCSSANDLLRTLHPSHRQSSTFDIQWNCHPSLRQLWKLSKRTPLIVNGKRCSTNSHDGYWRRNTFHSANARVKPLDTVSTRNTRWLEGMGIDRGPIYVQVWPQAFAKRRSDADCHFFFQQAELIQEEKRVFFYQVNLLFHYYWSEDRAKSTSCWALSKQNISIRQPD